ncbi:MAG: guanylate kinase [Pirellulales bacterium]|nr:guanylate kinase [Pirellulales bacterium]
MTANNRGRIVIISGPSGAGKTTVLAEVLKQAPVPLVKSVSTTTRRPRPAEVDGEDYHFISAEEFEKRRLRGDFLECFEVFGSGQWYGTLESEVDKGLQDGKWVVLEIDVQGALEVIKQFPDAITIFVSPGGREELERRLRGRGTESDDAVERRLEEAYHEMDQADRYRYQVVNDDVRRAVDEIRNILSSNCNTEKKQDD